MDRREVLREQILSQNPTDQQKDAIFADEQEFLLRASPGSGKTWTSCRRFIWRAANWSRPCGGLALLSFTNSAIREFQQATIKVGQQQLLSDPNYIGTFDAFVERFILAPFGHLLNGSLKRPRLFGKPRPGDRANTKLRAWTEDATGKKWPVYAWDIFPHLENNKVVFKTSKDLGGKKLTIGGPNPVVELMKLGYYAHSQRAFWACHLVVERPHIADRLAMRFPEIIVDEAQDTNVWLLVLLNLLRKRGSRVTVVGDPDQCIYSFAMADATSLPALKEKWDIPEKPLSRSFRCNNPIALAARNIGGNKDFTGRGDVGGDSRRPFVIREVKDNYNRSITAFQNCLSLAGIAESSSAILCRSLDQLQCVRGKANYASLQGDTKSLAEAAFFRDCRKDYKEAFDRVEEFLRSTIWDEVTWQTYDEHADTNSSRRIKLEIWKFVKTPSGLPPVTLGTNAWIAALRERLGHLMERLGVENAPSLGQKIRKNGLLQTQFELPLFEDEALFPAIRNETIHKVKGESIDAVLVLGSGKFWNSVVSSVGRGENSEDRRLAYVAMSRARDLLVISLPASHFDKHFKKWAKWGFAVLP